MKYLIKQYKYLKKYILKLALNSFMRDLAVWGAIVTSPNCQTSKVIQEISLI